MLRGVAAEGLQGCAGVGALGEGGGEDDPEGGEAGGGEVDEVVEAGGGPAEALVAGGAVADHAVGGVDGLVEGDAGEAEEGAPEGGGGDAVGEVLGEAFDGGAGDVWRLEGFGVAADDFRDGVAGFGEADLQCLGDGGDVVVEAALGEEGAGEKGEEDLAGKAERAGGGGEEDGGECGCGEEEGQGESAGGPGGRGLVEVAVEGGDEGADPYDGVADAAEEGAGVAYGGFDEEGGGGEGGEHGYG